MNDTIIITLIVAVVILLALTLYRNQLSRFFFKASKDGLETSLETHESTASSALTNAAPTTNPAVDVSGNTQKGSGNQINVGRSDSRVRQNQQTGKNNKINIKSDTPNS